jgi:hypothetical protein
MLAPALGTAPAASPTSVARLLNIASSDTSQFEVKSLKPNLMARYWVPS